MQGNIHTDRQTDRQKVTSCFSTTLETPAHKECNTEVPWRPRCPSISLSPQRSLLTYNTLAIHPLSVCYLAHRTYCPPNILTGDKGSGGATHRRLPALLQTCPWPLLQADSALNI